MPRDPHAPIDEANKFVREEIERWSEVIQAGNL